VTQGLIEKQKWWPTWPKNDFSPKRVEGECLLSRTTDTQWRHKSKNSEILGRSGRQNMLRPYLKIWDWDFIFGRAVKAIFLLGVRSPCLLLWPSLLLLLSFCLNMNLLGGSFNNYVDQILHTFWPPTPLEWTIVDILHKTYPLFTWPGMDFLLNTYLPLLVHVVNEQQEEDRFSSNFHIGRLPWD
jgi:hypothetical protein